MFKFIKLMVLIVSLAFLTACGGGGGNPPQNDKNTTQEKPNVAPTAKATVTPTTVTQGDTVSFDGSSSSDSDGTIVSYLWRDGATTLSTQANFTTTTLAVGSHNITLTVTDDDNATATDSVTVTVKEKPNVAPIAKATATPTTVTQGDAVSFDGSSSSDSDGSIVSYQWRDGATTLSTQANFTTTTLTVGSHNITLTVTDDDNATATDSVTVTVKEKPNVAPTAKAKATPTTVTQGDAVSFDGSSSSDSDGSIVSYQWRDGATVLSTQANFTTTTLAVGSHNITLTVTDDDNATATDSVTVTVENANRITKEPKKTGQTKSYDENGTEVTDGSIKDDGYYQKGVEPSYTRDDATNIVTDHITGLEWADDAYVSSVKKPWLTQENYDKCTGSNGQTKDTTKCTDTSGDTATTYCANLTLGGHNDWRLPTIKELLSIADISKQNPAIDATAFKYVVSYGYWSSSAVVGDEYNAWGVYFDYGADYWYYKSDEVYVRCVRDGQ